MTQTRAFAGQTRLPVIAAPMFLVSMPELVVASCKAGIIGTFPALNHRTTAGFDAWLTDIEAQLSAARTADPEAIISPYGVNLIVHRTNPRVQADLEVIVRHKTPLVITSLGAVKEVVDAVHSYGGKVFHDITNIRHAQKAISAGVDGLILVTAGAGGHAGTLSPFALLPEVRAIFDGTICLAGCLSDGHAVASARALGADFAYMGTRFIAVKESAASDAYQEMIVDCRASNVVYTPKVSGIPANFLAPSLVNAGLNPDEIAEAPDVDLGKELDTESKAWKDIWSAGQGVGSIDDVPTVQALVDRMIEEYGEARSRL
ncbi:MAG: nitronate monooxygenase [Myxococcales bacterium]|nr:nitronate monooxygenase [Myxococcales bacterium]